MGAGAEPPHFNHLTTGDTRDQSQNLLILGASNALALTSVAMGDTTSTSVSINKTTYVSRHLIASEINKMCSSSSKSRMRLSCNTDCFNNDVSKCADSVRSRHAQSLYFSVSFYASV